MPRAGFAEALASAQREAMAAFGNARVLVEKYVAGAAPYRNSRSLPIGMATRFTSMSATARCSAAIRR